MRNWFYFDMLGICCLAFGVWRYFVCCFGSSRRGFASIGLSYLGFFRRNPARQHPACYWRAFLLINLITGLEILTSIA